MKLDEYLLNEKTVIFVAQPREEQLYRQIAGLQESYHKLFNESQAFSLNIRSLLKHKFPLGQDYLPSLSGTRPTLADFQQLTTGLTQQLRKLQSFIRMALSDQRQKLQSAIWHDNVQTVLDSCSAINSLSSLLSNGCITVDLEHLGTLRASLRQLYKLYGYKTDKQDVEATLRRWGDLLPNVDTILHKTRQRSNSGYQQRLVREKLDRVLNENQALRTEIDRLQQQLMQYGAHIKENVSRLTVSQALSQNQDEDLRLIRMKLDNLNRKYPPGHSLGHNYTFKQLDTRQRVNTEYSMKAYGRVTLTEPAMEGHQGRSETSKLRATETKKQDNQTEPSFCTHSRQPTA